MEIYNFLVIVGIVFIGSYVINIKKKLTEIESTLDEIKEKTDKLGTFDYE